MRDPNQIRTYHGIDMDPFCPDESEIDIRDIAHSLSLICRANGHIGSFYSVAQHCLNCEKEAKARGLNARIRLFCLLHDAAECYLSDLIRPIKRRFPAYCEAEERLIAVIYRKLAGFLPDEDELKAVGEIDDCLLYHEFLNLGDVRVFDDEPKLSGSLSFAVEEPAKVESRYIARFEALLSQLHS